MAPSKRSPSSTEEGVVTAIAIDSDKNSQSAVKWAVDNLLHKNSTQCILIHVRCQSLHPQDFDGAGKDGRPPTQEELQQFFLPYRGFCARKGIEAKEVVLHDIDIPSALADYVIRNSISNIVVGASNRNALTRKFKNADVPSSLLKCAPESCAVHVIAKGKVQNSRSGTPGPGPQTPTKDVRKSQFYLQPENPRSEDASRTTFSHNSWRSEGSDRISFDRSSGSFQVKPWGLSKLSHVIPSPPLSRSSTESSGHLPGNSITDSTNDFSGWPPSLYSADINAENLEFSVASEDSSRSSLSPHTPPCLEAEMRKLKLELKQHMDMYNTACKEAVFAKKKAKELEECKAGDERKTEEAKLAEEAALALAKIQQHKTKAAVEAAQMAQRLAEMESQKRKVAEAKAKYEAIERKRAMDSLAPNIMYRKYAIEEIEVATEYFASSKKIGEGGYGPVYKATINHTAVAIKVLRPNISQGLRQFQQEVEVLSCMRHPNMVLLLGACPEYGCLVYEHMKNGSLEDRLFRKDNTPPIPWKARFRIAAEIATALLFLHQSKPEPLVHRDLKPANILLDHNYVSKIADVGLARLVPPSAADCVTQYHMTAAAGTFCYIDPEYQQTGMLGVKSDLYSLGVMLLQLITAKPPMGLGHQVEEAIEKGTILDILDPAVTHWPVEEALSLAKLALKCCELRKRDRPDLASVVLPELIRLRDLRSDKEPSDNDNAAFIPRPHNSSPVETQVSYYLKSYHKKLHLQILYCS
ncbi:Pkinase domain-containing protein/Usp domain-containing protein [Cephalotus follicularis]|uniref:RING-type E3 ubiquitin transferase n=1 Tax=Cephalotus follicularis TaxID=3775 RepID=A0A1Q3CXQ6_CEPFO|nr:Pkinase domain-containing protein/Usp domain-containing protein [Cephalotus follicularis]